MPKTCVSSIEKSSQMNLKTEEALKNRCRNIDNAFKKSGGSLKTPILNLFGKCPKCGNKKYWELFGGRCNKKCARCNTAYDCISAE